MINKQNQTVLQYYALQDGEGAGIGVKETKRCGFGTGCWGSPTLRTNIYGTGSLADLKKRRMMLLRWAWLGSVAIP